MRTIERGVRVAIGVVLVISFEACAPAEVRQGVAAHDLAAAPPQNAVRCTSYGAGPQSSEIGHRGGMVTAEHRHAAGSRRHALRVDSASLGPSERLTFRIVEPQNGFLSLIATHNGAADRAFNPPLTLHIGYDGCAVDDPSSLIMYRWDGSRWEQVPGFQVDERTRSVWAPRPTLSQYALGAS